MKKKLGSSTFLVGVDGFGERELAEGERNERTPLKKESNKQNKKTYHRT